MLEGKGWVPSPWLLLQVTSMYMGLFSSGMQYLTPPPMTVFGLSPQPALCVLQHCRVYPEPMMICRTTEMALSFPYFSPHTTGLAAGSPVFPQVLSRLYSLYLWNTSERCRFLTAHLSLIMPFMKVEVIKQFWVFWFFLHSLKCNLSLGAQSWSHNHCSTFPKVI